VQFAEGVGHKEVFDKEKFAELIVQECADLTRWQEYSMSVEQRIRLEIYHEIKEHFGVDE
jgi:predicted Zn-dependent protease with MMP-like domain